MDDFLTVVAAFILGIILGSSIFELLDKGETEKQLCEYSKYSTSDYQVINGSIYCRSSDNSFQLLTKHKPKSKHLLDHRSDKSE